MISSDPRHGTGESSGVAVRASGFSAWPDPLGLAATRDVALVEEFGRIANQEYRAVGIRTATSPHGGPGHRAPLGSHLRHVW